MTPDIKDMHYADVKNKLLKLAQAYNTEKMRNKDFELVLRKAVVHLSEMKKLEAKLDFLEKNHTDMAERLLQRQTELKKSEVYKETIK